MAEVEILHRRAPDDCRAIHRVLAHGHRSDMHARIEIRLGVVARVVAERSLHDELLGGVDVALDHDLRIRRYLEIAGHRLRELHRRLPQEPREDVLVDVRRQRSTRRIHRRGIGADDDAHRHLFAALRHLGEVRRPRLVALPMHRDVLLPHLLHAIHPDIANAACGILRHHGRHREEGTAVFRPSGEHREPVEIDVVALPDDFLARRRSRGHARRELRHLKQAREQLQLAEEALRHLEVE